TGSTLADGSYAVVATVTDTAGNTASSSQDVIVDTVADAPDVIAVAGGSVGIVPGLDNVQLEIYYTNENDEAIVLTAIKAPDGTWSLDTTPVNVSINPTTGVVSIGRDAVKDGSLVSSVGTDQQGNIASDADFAQSDDLTPSAADAPDVLALNDGSVTVTPGADNVRQDIQYKNESNVDVYLIAEQAGDGTWSLDNTPPGVSIDPITGVVTIGQDAVKDGSEVTSLAFDVSNNTATDSDFAKGDVVTLSVSEEGLSGGNPDSTGNPTDTTNQASITGTLSLGVLTDVSVAGPAGITSDNQTVTWSGVFSAGVYTLTGTAGGVEVAELTLSTAGAYTFTLKQPLDHLDSLAENILALGFTITSTDTVGTTDSTLIINVEDDAPIAAPDITHIVDVQPTSVEGELVVSYGGDGGYVKSISVDGYTLTYFPDSDSISASGTAGSITYSFNTTNDELTINKGTGEVLVVDMLTGHYSYSALATETIAAPIVGINKTASLLGLVNAEALDLIGIGTNQLLTAVDPNNDIQSVVVNASSVISVGLGNYYKLDWSAAMAAEFGLSVIEDNNILNLVLVTTQSYSKLTITSLDGGPIDNFKLNEFLATVYVHQYGLNLVSLGLAPTISISATDSQPVTSTASYTDLLGVSLLDPNNDPAGVIEGNGSANTLNGTTSDDRLYGYAGDDTLNGGQGNDLLRGGAGTDALSGGSGNDILIGGTGNDTLTGGSGNDTFLWEKGDQGTVNAGRALDIITDFSNQPVTGGGDILDLRGLLIGELAKGTSIGNLANFLFFVKSGADTILYISTDGAFGATPSSTLADQQITFQNVDLIGSFTTQQEIISNLLKNGNLLVDQATTTTDVNGTSSFDVVIADNDGDTASTNLTFDSSTPLTTNPDNVAPVAQATDATLLGLVGLDALGIIDLNQQAFVVADANQNLRSVEVKFTGLLTVNLGTLTMSASNQLASDLGLEIHISNTAGVLNVVGATSTITITAVDGGNIDNLAINELLATIQLESGVDLLGLSATLGLQALGSFTVTATDSYGLTDTDTVSSLLNASVLQRLLGGDASQDIIEGSSANDTLNNSLLGTIHERLYGFDGDDTLNGGNGNDLLRGGAGNDILNGEDGNDILIDGNGADTLNGGNGNDLILISGTGFAAIDGGAGTDTLTLLGGIDLDLSAHNNITNIERIDLANGTEGSKLTLTESDVLEVTGTNTLQIFGDANDQVEMIGAIKGLSTSIGGVAVTQYTLGANTVYVDNDIVNGMGVIIV
ncbi:beta strand repeat-containing protein, partial [Acinetobacter zhairhuonensis]